MVSLFDEIFGQHEVVDTTLETGDKTGSPGALMELKLVAHDLRKAGAGNPSAREDNAIERATLNGMNIALVLIENAIAKLEGK